MQSSIEITPKIIKVPFVHLWIILFFINGKLDSVNAYYIQKVKE